MTSRLIDISSALSPVSPFDTWPRNRFGLVLIGVGCSFHFVSAYMVSKTTTFLLGFLIFGDPIISRSLLFLNKNYPHWMELLEPRKYASFYVWLSRAYADILVQYHILWSSNKCSIGSYIATSSRIAPSSFTSLC